MPEYYVDAKKVFRDERERYEEIARKIARAVSDTGSVDQVFLRGFAEPLKGVDEEAFGVLERGTDDEFTGVFETEVTGDMLNAVISLFSSSLMRVVFLDSDGERVFGRYDDGQIYFRIPNNGTVEELESTPGVEIRELDSDRIDDENITEDMRDEFFE